MHAIAFSCVGWPNLLCRREKGKAISAKKVASSSLKSLFSWENSIFALPFFIKMCSLEKWNLNPSSVSCWTDKNVALGFRAKCTLSSSTRFPSCSRQSVPILVISTWRSSQAKLIDTFDSWILEKHSNRGVVWCDAPESRKISDFEI